MEELTKLNILYEDNHVIVVEKKPNIPVCADSSNDLDLLTIIKKYIKEKYNKPGNVYLGLVHRLDRPVGGVMVFAKTSKSASRLSKQINENKFKKVYLAVVKGKVNAYDTLKDYLVKDEKTNTSYVTTKDKGKQSILDYELISYKDNMSLVKINLHTGRSHQIRVQFSSRNHPLIADARYNKESDLKTNIALFASSLSFYHPITNEYLTFTLDIPKRYPFNIF